MRSLRLVALTDDGKSLVLALDGAEPGEEGERFELPIDDRVRAAARGDARRLGQIDVEIGVTLPPRVIQARIRAGETPEQVAQASGIRVERIMRFAHPVLQERERVAEQAREARVRLSEGAPSVPLQQFMSERLRLLGADLDAVRWDAHRAGDGVWQVTAAWQAGAKSGVTRWAYDVPARTVTPVDAATTDFAEGTRLVRVVPHVPAERPPPVRPRPVSVVPDDDGVPAPASSRLARDEDDRSADDDVRPVLPVDVSPAVTRRADPAPPADEDDISEHDTVVLGRPGGEGDDDEDPRARIPAWEDIVFGVRRHR
ncbi:septation protein SepH [Geodermatophilus obscurus]|uniref:DNA-binding protein n=1 Tax=Geodermatophilus obscurus (strain ATCC 25078 / DSM 43160 / JCM 3152 / CCUG 61914 / KCC A-0152 / KCTC 9177 / NBRC 13315 / NRRL B-3577 / G-20) TaxID=526225 RepID=D2S8H0_GEOOG|nr:septation protein SepH [Geodermatophilus obscurus]ADB73592.1 DNA-binding protein [Geodermatophilus obscurus DSM 43160]